MEKIHPTTRQTEQQILAQIRRSLLIADPHAAMQRKPNTVLAKFRQFTVAKSQAA